jgi:hypothetical protein
VQHVWYWVGGGWGGGRRVCFAQNEVGTHKTASLVLQVSLDPEVSRVSPANAAILVPLDGLDVRRSALSHTHSALL